MSKAGLDATETPRDVAFCAHAITTPGKITEVVNTTDNCDPELRECLQDIQEDTQHAGEIIRTLREFIRRDDSKKMQ